MKIKTSLRTKMLVYILTASVIVYILVLGYISLKIDDISRENAASQLDTYTKEFANYTTSILSVEMNMARSFAQVIRTCKDKPQNEIENVFSEMLENLIKDNPNAISVWINYELKALNPDWKKSHGRLRFTYFHSDDSYSLKREILDTIAGYNRGAYYKILEEKVEYVMQPYYDTYVDNEILMTSVAVPIIDDGIAIGALGFDIEFSRYQELISSIQPIEGSYAFLIAHNGQYVAHGKEEYIGTFIQDSLNIDSDILEKISKGKFFKQTFQKNNKDNWVSYAPVKVGSSPMLWSLGVVVPVDVIMAEERTTMKRSLITGLIGLLLIAFLIWIIAYNISKPIVKTTNTLEYLAKGDIDDSKKVKVERNDEIGKMRTSVNELIEGLNKTAVFAQEIGKGNLDMEHKLLSDKDLLGKSLIEMKESLKIAKEQETKRKQEDQKQNWATQGLAKFGEILRQNNDDMKEFSYHIISNLVKYVNANQGGLFVINDDDKNDIFIELLACYAYERRKFMDKRIDMGVGLIGRCIKEQKTIHMTALPEDYITITSGLGKAVPDSLLIIPLKVNEEIFGAIELAGFNKFEDHVIKFVEELGESIASTISSTKINIRTNQLLAQSQQQSEEMAAQEEEMRQNMEELQATQEEAGRRSKEMQGLLDALNKANLVIEYDLEGHIISVNDNYLKLVQASRDDLIGTHHTDNMKLNKKQTEEYKSFWNELKNGIPQKKTENVEFNNKEYLFVATYTPIFDEYDSPVKILKIATDITEIKNIK